MGQDADLEACRRTSVDEDYACCERGSESGDGIAWEQWGRGVVLAADYAAAAVFGVVAVVVPEVERSLAFEIDFEQFFCLTACWDGLQS